MQIVVVEMGVWFVGLRLSRDKVETIEASGCSRLSARSKVTGRSDRGESEVEVGESDTWGGGGLFVCAEVVICARLDEGEQKLEVRHRQKLEWWRAGQIKTLGGGQCAVLWPRRAGGHRRAKKLH